MSFRQSLCNLPNELLITTFQYLCAHCCDMGSSEWDVGAEERIATGLKALASLCLTSKDLYSVAAPILYHELPSWSAVGTFRFLLTLSAKPHLANCVRKAGLTGDAWDGSFSGHWVEEVTPEQLQMLRVAFPVFGLTMPGEVGEDGQESDEYHSVAMREFISRAKFIEHVMIHGLTHPMEFGDREAQAWLALTSRPDILANLRVLERGYTYSRGGFCLDDEDTSIQSFVLAASPKLERLLLVKCSEIALASVYASVTVVELAYSNLTTAHLTQLLQRLPALQDFAYESGGIIVGDERDGTEHRPAEAPTCLRSRAATLQRVSLDYSNAELLLDASDFIGSFSDFPALRRLKLDAGSVLPASHTSPPGESGLVSILPRSLRSLEISGAASSPANCTALVTAIASGQFPQLREVAFYDIAAPEPASGDQGDDSTPTRVRVWGPIRDSFRAQGVAATLTAYYARGH